MSIYKQYDLPLEEGLDDGPPSASIRARMVREQGILDEAFAILAKRHQRGETLSDPEATKNLLRLKLAEKKSEVFGCIFLDNRHRVIAVEDLFFGTIDGAAVYPRVIVEKALLHNAAAIIAYHNHTSGVAEPSQSDIMTTQRTKDALALVDIRLIDHVIATAGEAVSLAERNLL